MKTKTKIIIGVSVVALVGGYFIYKRMRINKPMNNAIGDKDGKVELPPSIKEDSLASSTLGKNKLGFPVPLEKERRYALPKRPTVEEVKEMNRLIALP